MCGIFGIVLPKGEKPDKKLVEAATDQLFHRGPDSSGYFFEDNLALGNRRLAILDLSEDGKQPIHYQDLTITYNGELYNYLELKKELQKKGHAFKTNTDTEVVLVAYKEWGKACVNRFNGMWAFAIYDSKAQTLFCSRDRFGIKPFYYHWENGTLTFASEIKAFKPLPFWKAILNKQTAADYLIKGLQNHTEQTLFKNIKQLQAGHHLFFDLKSHTLKLEQYYNLREIEPNTTITFEEAATTFRTLLKDSIRLHSRSDVKVGAALSGGLDSSSIVALQYELLGDQPENLEVVSYASEVPQFDESPFVESLIKRYPVKVHKVSASFKETLAKIDEVILAHDAPLLSASLIAGYSVFKKAKEKGLKVMIDGQGADEILAGYGTYYIPFLKEIGIKRLSKLIPEAFGLLGKHNIKLSKKLSFFKKTSNLDELLQLPESQSFVPFKNFQDYCIYMIEKGILPYLLHFEDRNSMAHSVESRVPFLDFRFVEFCMSLPADFKIKKGIRKAILRAAMKEMLPEKILKRYDKMGFSTPQESWINNNPEFILDRIKNTLANYPDLFNKGFLSFVEGVLSKKETTHYSFLWRVMTFGRWMELYSVKN